MDGPADARADFEARRLHALAMGNPKRLAWRRENNIMNARERLDHLFDAGTGAEIGLLATSQRPEDKDRSAADGKITMFGKIEGRPAAAIANDFTTLGASSGPINSRKIAYMKQAATRDGMPLIFLGESSGGRIPDSMGAKGMGISSLDPTQYLRTRATPWVSGVLGSCFGSSVWYSCLSDFVVMRKGATMAVASSRVTSLAIGCDIDLEDLGGWRLHAEITGLIDLAVDTDEEAIDAIRRYLSYLPSHAAERPPLALPIEANGMNVAEIVPEDRSTVYDVRKVIAALVDRDTFFPLKERFAKSLVTGLARMGGHTVGIIANNPMVKGGALDVDACDKAMSMLVLCDSFNIPIINLVDTPGFLVGPEGERRKAPGQIMNFVQALQQCSVPRITVIMRKLFGQAYMNMGGGGNSDVIATWYGAEVSFMDPAVAVNIVYNVRPDTDPEKFTALRNEMSASASAFELASVFASHVVIPPEDTRRFILNALDVHSRRPNGGIGEHRLSNWPTSF